MHAEEDGKPMNRGLAPINLLRNMHAANKAYPNLKSVDEFLETIPVDLPSLRLAPEQSDERYRVYQVRNDAAARFECEYKYGFVAPPKTREAYGDTYGVAVRFKPPKSAAQVFYFTWRKEKAGWRIVSYDTEASMVKQAVPDLRVKTAETKAETYPGDPALVQTVDKFMQNLLLKRNAAEAMKSFSLRATACYGLYSADAVDTKIPDAEKLQKIRKGFSDGVARLGRRPSLADYTQGIAAWDEYAKVVPHKEDAAFSIFALPDAVGLAADCAHRTAGNRMDLKRPIEPKYGAYYGSVFKFRVPGEQPAVLFLLWAKDGGAWKVTSYHIEAP
jgi:hypothetical protein